jgi:hypothetical protein
LIEEAEGLALTGGNSSGNQSAAVAAAPVLGYSSQMLRVNSNLEGATYQRGWRLGVWGSTSFKYFGTDYVIGSAVTPVGSQSVVFREFASYVAPGVTPVTLSSSGEGVLVAGSYSVPGDRYAVWMGGYSGVADVTWSADSDRDGASNLLEYALNLSPTQSDAREMAAGGVGTGGLPSLSVERGAGGEVSALRLEWVQRRQSELVYQAEKSTALGAAGGGAQGGWEPVTSPAPVLSDIDTTWQRATLTLPAGGTALFVRLNVSIP